MCCAQAKAIAQTADTAATDTAQSVKIVGGSAAHKTADSLKRSGALNYHLRNKRLDNLLQQGWQSIRRTPSIQDTTTLNIKPEDQYKPFEGKHIRRIYFSSLGFERSFNDTSTRIRNFITHAATTLHRESREWAIQQQLFIHPGDKVNPFELADNERYLRGLSFLQDVRILIQPAYGYEDSVDILVVTKDIFSLKADLDFSGIAAVRLRAGEDNFLGWGQQLRVAGQWQQGRYPSVGYEALYSKYSIGGSFINATILATQIDGGASEGFEPEAALALRLNRPLVSPYTKLAGGAELSYNQSQNLFRRPDSLFYRYRYAIYDAWAGYNLSFPQILNGGPQRRARQLLSLRYLQRKYDEIPYQIGERLNPIYNDRQAVLAQLTLFWQNFIKTQYIYGFGITEDLPYGYNVSITTGWWQQLNLRRAYAGVDAQFYGAYDNGSFGQYYAKLGGFFGGQAARFEDISALAGFDYFSRIYGCFGRRIRHHFRGSYSEILRPVTTEPLRLNNDFGLQKFNTDSAAGYRRIVAGWEGTLFLHRKVLGFSSAPFIGLSAAALYPKAAGFWDANTGLYPGVSTGVRARNENLVFGTLELRAIYFPKHVPGLTTFRIELASNLRYRFRTEYIAKPDVVRLNADIY